jgi:hypothetical protein
MKTKLLIAMSSALLLSSCGNKDSQVPALAAPVVNSGSNAGTIIENKEKNGEWIVEEKSSRDGDVSFRSESLPADRVEEYSRREYRATQLKQVPVDPGYNTQLFRIEGEDTKNAVFVAPKIYAYSGNEANKLEPLVDDDKGTMTLYFPIVFIDGLSETIESPNPENGLIKLPQNLLVQKRAELLKFLNSHYRKDGEQNLASLPGCPKEIVMTVAGEEFVIAKDILLKSDFCQYNKPIYASITLPKARAMWLLEEGLYSGAAKISALFETRVPYIVTKLKIEMNKQKIFEDLAIKLKVNHPYAEVEITTEIQKIVKEQAAKISIQGDFNEHLETIIRQAIDHFFEKMPADPKKEDMSCGNALTCFKLSYKKQNYDDKFSVEWTHTTNVLSGQNILTWTVLSSLFDDSVKVENVKNDGSKRATGLTLYEGSLIDLKVTSLLVEKAKQTQKTTRKDNQVVIGSRPGPDCLFAGEPGEGGHRDYCRREPQKVYQNQWVDTVTYSFEAMSEQIIGSPNGKADEILNNIGFEFQWNENGKTVTRRCAANLFGRYGDGRSMLIKIENVPGCVVFTKNSANRPILALYNSANVKAEGIKVGFRTTNWVGQVTGESIKELDYTVNSIFSGAIMRRGAIKNDSNSKPGIRLLEE